MSNVTPIFDSGDPSKTSNHLPFTYTLSPRKMHPQQGDRLLAPKQAPLGMPIRIQTEIINPGRTTHLASHQALPLRNHFKFYART